MRTVAESCVEIVELGVLEVTVSNKESDSEVRLCAVQWPAEQLTLDI